MSTEESTINATAQTRAEAAEEVRPGRETLLAFVLMVLLGGANGVAIRYSNAELPPFWGAALRFTGAALLFWAILLAMRLTLPRGRALAGTLLYAALSAGAYAFFYWGLVEVQAGIAQVVIALVPLMTFFLALAHRQERFRMRGLVGAVLAVGGIAFAFSGQLSSSVPLAPLLAIVAGAACVAEGGVLIKGFPRVHPVVVNAFAMTTGGLFLPFASLAAGESWYLPQRPATWAALAFLVVVGSVVVFTLFLYVLRHWTASATSYQFVLLPFVTVALSAWLTGEQITPSLVVGGVLVLAGVWVGALTPPVPPPPSVASPRDRARRRGPR